MIEELYNTVIAPQLKDGSPMVIFNTFFQFRYNKYAYLYQNLPQTLKGSLRVTIGKTDVSLVFPRTLLQPYDTVKQRSVDIDIPNYQKSALRFKVKSMQYDNRDRKSLSMQRERGTSFCFQPSELTGTGIVFSSNDFAMNIVNNPRYKGIWLQNSYPA